MTTNGTEKTASGFDQNVAAALCYSVGWLTGLLFLLITPRGRLVWRDRGLWLALGISALGLVPLLLFNVEHGWVALGFQLVERNPWSFHADALVQPLEQAIVCTPPFYLLLLWAAVRAARRANDGEPWDLLAVCALGPIVGYFVLGCFADGDMRGVCEVRSLRSGWCAEAELAFTVEKAWRGRGIGTALMARAIRAARDLGIEHLYLTCHPGNRGMQCIAAKFAATMSYDDGECFADISMHCQPMSALLEPGEGGAPACSRMVVLDL